MRPIKLKHREKNYTLKKEKNEGKRKNNQSKYKVLMLKSSHKCIIKNQEKKELEK